MINEKELGFWMHFIQDWLLDPRMDEWKAVKPLLKWHAQTGKSLRPFYEAFACLVELPMQSGQFDEEYGLNNLPYLLNAYWEEEDWSYRLYVCFTGKADVQPVWHCCATYRFEKQEQPSSERFDYLEDTSSPREERLRLKFKGKRRTAPQVAA